MRIRLPSALAGSGSCVVGRGLLTLQVLPVEARIMSDVRWGILGAAKFAREFMGPALTLAPGGHVAALATSDPAKADPFRADMGGGGLRDIGVYVMGGARFATGREATDVRARIQWEDGVDVYAAITAKFGDADDVNFTSIRMHPRQEITFHGDAGGCACPCRSTRVSSERHGWNCTAERKRSLNDGRP